MNKIQNIQNNQKVTLDSIYNEVVLKKPINTTLENQSNLAFDSAPLSTFNKLKNWFVNTTSNIKNSALGIGHGISNFLTNTLPKVIAPNIKTIPAVFPRAAGGLVTFLATAPRLFQAYRADRQNNNYSNTRKEVTLAASSITPPLIIGHLGSIGATLLAGAGASAATLTAAGVLTTGLAIYSAYKAHEYINNKYFQ